MVALQKMDDERPLYYDDIPEIVPYEDYDHHKVSSSFYPLSLHTFNFITCSTYHMNSFLFPF